MRIECSWTRDDLKKYLKKKRRPTNIFFLVFGIYFYFSFMRYAFRDENADQIILWLGFLLYLGILIAVLWIFTNIYAYTKLRRNDKKTGKAYGNYIIEVNNKFISSTVNKEKISYPWKDITSCKIRKNYFLLRTKEDRIGLCFRREILKDDYEKLLSLVKKNIPV